MSSLSALLLMRLLVGCGFLCAFLAGLPVPALSATVRLQISVSPGIPPLAGEPVVATLTAKLRAEKGQDSPDTSKPISFELQAPGSQSIDLVSGVWDLTLKAPGYWSPPSVLEVEEPQVSSKLEVWPTGSIHALLVSGKEPLPEVAAVRFRPSAGSEKIEKRSLQGRVDCAIRDQRLMCSIPAGAHDLRFDAADFIRHYAWDVRVPTGGVRKLGEIHLRKGAAVLGWVTAEGGNADVAGAKVVLTPRAATRSRSPAVDARLERLGVSAVTNHRGFFQIHGIPAGEYVLAAEKKPFATTRVTVRVLEGKITEVANPPLVLREPQVVAIYVDPAVPPIGDRWTLRWIEIDRGSSVIGSRGEMQVTESGLARVEEMAPGRYLAILGVGEERWYSEEIEVETAQPPIFIQLPVIEVRGTMLFGDDPLEGELWFGGRDGQVTLPLKSDEKGRFRGYLPRPGSWEVDVVADAPRVRRSLQDVEVEARDGKSYAEPEIRLPNTLLRGIVVDEESILVPDATVTAQSLDEIVKAQRLRSDDGGEFEIHGLPPGRVSVVAENARGEELLYSQEIQLNLENDGEPAEVRLVLRPERRIRGRVVAEGRGIPGARIKAEPSHAMGLPLFPEISDAEGFFEIHLPAQTTDYFLSVGAPGFGFRFVRVPVTLEQPVVVTLTQASGSVVIGLPEGFAIARWDAPKIFLYHNGAVESLGYLSSWASFNGARSNGRGPIVIPKMEPGEYTACQVSQTERYPHRPGDPGSHVCASGYLTEGGLLELSFEADESSP